MGDTHGTDNQIHEEHAAEPIYRSTTMKKSISQLSSPSKQKFGGFPSAEPSSREAEVQRLKQVLKTDKTF